MRNEESVQGSWLRKNEEVHPREVTGRDCLTGEGGLYGKPSEGDEREQRGRRLDQKGRDKAHYGGLRPRLPQAKPALGAGNWTANLLGRDYYGRLLVESCCGSNSHTGGAGCYPSKDYLWES